MKTCTECKIEKDEDCFYNSRSKCKKCIKEYNKQYRIEHKEERREYDKQYYTENKEERRKNNKQYRAEHKEEIKEQKKQYYIENKEEISEYKKQSYIENKEKIKQYYIENKEEILENKKQYYAENKEGIKQYRAENKEHINENKNEYQKNRKKTDPAFKLRNNVSISVNKALRSNGSSKNGKSILKHLPYTIEELKQYLELLFESWMSWGNHGKYNAKTWDEDDQSTWVWNIEHITPQAHLPYTSMEDNNFKKCWELENLRPYNAKKNIEEKNNRSQEEISKIKNDIKEHLEKLKS